MSTGMQIQQIGLRWGLAQRWQGARAALMQLCSVVAEDLFLLRDGLSVCQSFARNGQDSGRPDQSVAGGHACGQGPRTAAWSSRIRGCPGPLLANPLARSDGFNSSPRSLERVSEVHSDVLEPAQPFGLVHRACP